MESSISKVKKEGDKDWVLFNLRVDLATMKAIEKIAASLPEWMGKGGRKSAAVRMAVREYADRLDNMK